MCWTSELLKSQTCLEEGTGGGRMNILTEDGERLPQGIGLEGENDFHACFIGHSADKRQVTPQELFLQQIDGLVDLLKSLSVYSHASLKGLGSG